MYIALSILLVLSGMVAVFQRRIIRNLHGLVAEKNEIIEIQRKQYVELDKGMTETQEAYHNDMLQWGEELNRLKAKVRMLDSDREWAGSMYVESQQTVIKQRDVIEELVAEKQQHKDRCILSYNEIRTDRIANQQALKELRQKVLGES